MAKSPQVSPHVSAALPVTREALLQQAFELAFFLHGDAEVAGEVTARALAKLAAAAVAQERRFAYLPRKRRTRVSIGNAHLLQRLIYVESEPFERRSETLPAGAEPGEAEWVIRFVKHLVRMLWKRNSFYAVLGVSRILHSYSTAEAMDLYALVIQDPERVRDDYYFRSRKRRLMDELLERFGDRLEVVRQERGEQRFRTLADPGPLRELVAEALRRFMPWGTSCPVPEGFQPWETSLPGLAFTGENPDLEHAVELHRFHAALDPVCFQRLVHALRLPPPEQKLAVPLFRRSTPVSADRPPPRAPSPEDRRAIAARFAEEEKRRRRSSSRYLSIRVDGAERARLDRAEDRRAQISVADGAERVEIYGAEDGALLAVLPLGGLGAAPAPRSAVRLRGRERIELAVTAEDNPPGGWRVEVGVRRLLVFGAAWPAWPARPGRPLQAVAAAALLCAAGWVWVLLSTAPARQPSRANPERPIGSSPRPRPATPALPVQPPSRPAAPQPEGETRRLRVSPPGAELAEVKAIFVDPLGAGTFAAQLRAALVAQLQAAGFLVPADRESADAVLQGAADANGRVVLQLVNADGGVLWRTNQGSGKPLDSPAELARSIVEELRAAHPESTHPEGSASWPRGHGAAGAGFAAIRLPLALQDHRRPEVR